MSRGCEINPFTGKGFEYFIDDYKFKWWAWPLSFILSFHPFYFPRYPYSWKQKKRFTLNHFKGYSWFGLHYSEPTQRGHFDGAETSHQHMYIGFTLFYLRVEFHFMWGHKGRNWYKFKEWRQMP